MSMRRALVSVSDKTGVEEFARALYDMGVYHIARMLYLLGNPEVLRISGKTYQEVEMDAARRASSGYNADTDTYEDLFKAGVIDPAKVVRTALEDAASIAGLLITTEAMVADEPKDDAPAMGGGDMGGMGGMGGMM